MTKIMMSFKMGQHIFIYKSYYDFSIIFLIFIKAFHDSSFYNSTKNKNK